jgi:NAD(P)-dependent dehydrogenase (short-subunit alcohol dehydrogenase family)
LQVNAAKFGSAANVGYTTLAEALLNDSTATARAQAAGSAPTTKRDPKENQNKLLGEVSTPIPGNLCRFIVNVSAMEGKFHRRKLPTHPHTNMAKAALNMMTRTSAQDYAQDLIFMNAVDTGWSE